VQGAAYGGGPQTPAQSRALAAADVLSISAARTARANCCNDCAREDTLVGDQAVMESTGDRTDDVLAVV